jgi:hypothetical protein
MSKVHPPFKHGPLPPPPGPRRSLVPHNLARPGALVRRPRTRERAAADLLAAALREVALGRGRILVPDLG